MCTTVVSNHRHALCSACTRATGLAESGNHADCAALVVALAGDCCSGAAEGVHNGNAIAHLDRLGLRHRIV